MRGILLSTGLLRGSLAAALVLVDALRKKGITVDTAVVLLDRQEGVRLLAVFGAREMFEYA